MALFPSVQARIQDEIDSVVGSSRPPAFDDQPKMPYLRAAVLETLRWNPVVAMGRLRSLPFAKITSYNSAT